MEALCAEQSNVRNVLSLAIDGQGVGAVCLLSRRSTRFDKLGTKSLPSNDAAAIQQKLSPLALIEVELGVLNCAMLIPLGQVCYQRRVRIYLGSYFL